jgi:3-deoxy-D-manno-octulosonic-acid transferase
MYFLYSLLLAVGFVALLPRFLLDTLRHGKYAAGFGERMGRYPRFDARGRTVIWLHCVSVGETQAARPLVRALLERYPSHTLVVSTVTETGQQLAREVFADTATAIFYFPFDWAWTVRRALRIINPSVVLVMETELWPRFLRECGARGIPVALVNGRISDTSFRRYKIIRRFISRVTRDISLAIMQTDTDASRLAALGLAPERIRVSGNVKFDVETETAKQTLTDELRARFHIDDARPLIVAASTHAPEERMLLEAFKQLRAASLVADARHDADARRITKTNAPHAHPRLLIAPRHPERFDEVATLLDTSGLRWSRRKAQHDATNDAQCDVILLDTIGELRGVYPLAALVFVGGSLARTGGHNVLEPASYARCIVTGAHTFNFKSIIREFFERDALVQIPDVTDDEAPTVLARVLGELLHDSERRERMGDNALAALVENRGATERTIEMLAPIFDADSTHTNPGLPVNVAARMHV